MSHWLWSCKRCHDMRMMLTKYLIKPMLVLLSPTTDGVIVIRPVIWGDRNSRRSSIVASRIQGCYVSIKSYFIGISKTLIISSITPISSSLRKRNAFRLHVMMMVMSIPGQTGRTLVWSRRSSSSKPEVFPRLLVISIETTLISWGIECRDGLGVNWTPTVLSPETLTKIESTEINRIKGESKPCQDHKTFFTSKNKLF